MIRKTIVILMTSFFILTLPAGSLLAAKHMTKRIVIAIDPGHGGNDYGAIGANKKAEKQITMDISMQLADLINLTPYLKAILTRKSDRYVGLKKRIDIARAHKARLMLSIHADAARTTKPNGASVYILSNQGERSSANIWLEQRENRGEFVSGMNLRETKSKLANVLIDLAQNKTRRQSLMLGQSILKFLGKVVRLHKKHVQKANFIVLKAPDIPSVLIETGFITNKNDAIKLSSPNYRHRIATAILIGIISYLNKHPLPNTAIAKNKIPRHIVYRVKRGDNLSMIALEFGLSSARLKKAAQLKKDLLQIGQTLIIPLRALS